MLMSEEQEVAMGAEYDPSVIATFGLYEDEALLSFLTEKGTELAKVSHRPNLDYHFRILDSPVVNAFAVPGGYIYFTRGILGQFNSEAELVGVLGHELGHVTARHSASQQSKQQLGQIVLISGLAISPEFRYFGDFAMQGMQLLFLKFSRDNENESDRLGVEYSSKIGYDAHKMADFFKVLEDMQLADNQGGVPTFLSTHPNPGDRYQAVHRQADTWQDSLKYGEWKVNQDPYLQRIDGLVYGEDPRQGFVESNVFYHPGLKFKFPFPQNWKLVNTPLQVQIAPEDGKALILLSLSSKKDNDQAIEEDIKRMNLQVIDRNSININGLPAVSINSKLIPQEQNDSAQDTIRVQSSYIKYADNVYVFHGVTFNSMYAQYAASFSNTMMNFDILKDPVRLNKQPNRIRIKQVNRTTTVQEALQGYGIKGDAIKKVALLNNLDPSESIQKGTLIKIISE